MPIELHECGQHIETFREEDGSFSRVCLLCNRLQAREKPATGLTDREGMLLRPVGQQSCQGKRVCDELIDCRNALRVERGIVSALCKERDQLKELLRKRQEQAERDPALVAELAAALADYGTLKATLLKERAAAQTFDAARMETIDKLQAENGSLRGGLADLHSAYGRIMDEWLKTAKTEPGEGRE